MKKYIIILIMVSLLTYCTNKTTFYYLEKLHYENIDGNRNNRPYTIDYVLIDNAPFQNDSLLKEEIVSYARSAISNKKYVYQSIIFYRKTRNTSYFIGHAEDPGGFSSEEISHYPEDEILRYSFWQFDDPTKNYEEIYNSKNHRTKIIRKKNYNQQLPINNLSN